MVAKYGEETKGWTCRSPEGALGYGLWKNISKGNETFSRFKINNGERVSFWHDPWCERGPLASSFPLCYALAKHK